MLWRIEDGRPISKLADEVVEETFETLPVITKRIMNTERITWQQRYERHYPSLHPGMFSIRDKTGSPLFGFYKVRYSDGLCNMDKCILGQVRVSYQVFKNPPRIWVWSLNDSEGNVPEVIATEYNKAVDKSIEDEMPFVKYCIEEANKKKQDNVRSCNVTLSSEFHGILPDNVKQQLPHFVSVYEHVGLVAEVKEWDLTVPKLHNDPFLVGIDIKNNIYILSHFDCTSAEEYVRREFSG